MFKKIIYILFIISLGVTFISCNSKEKFLVTFNSLEGTNVENVVVEEGSTLVIPATTRTGYTLDGWYTSLNSGLTYDEKWIFTTDLVNNNITLYAKWRISNITYTFGGSYTETFHSIIEDSDGNYVAVGSTSSDDYDITDGNNGSGDALIIKFDSDGNIIWNKTIGGSNTEAFLSIIEDSEGNYVAVGYADSDDHDITDGNNGFSDALIVKFDTEGNVIWDKTIGGYWQDSFNSIIEDNEGDYVVVGYTGSHDYDITDGNNGLSDALIVKIDTEGNVVWNKTIGGSESDYFYSIIEDSEGNYVTVGCTDSDDEDITDNSGSRDALIVKFDTEGNVIWNKTIGGSDWEHFNSIIEDNEGNYVVVGHTESDNNDITDGNNGSRDALIVKFNTEGNIIWDKTIGGSDLDIFNSVIEDNEGNYVIVGYTESDNNDITDGNNGLRDALIIKIDTEGNVIWDKTIGGSDSDYFYSIIQDSEGNYVAAGYTVSNDYDITDGNNGFNDVLIWFE